MSSGRRILLGFAAGACLVGGHLLGRVIPTSAEAETLPDAPRTRVAAPLAALPKHEPAAELLDSLPTAGAAEFPGLLEIALAEKDSQLRAALLRKLFDRWLKIDATAAYAAAARNNKNNGHLLSGLLDRWALVAPEAALDAVLADGALPQSIYEILGKVVSSDPQRFFVIATNYADRWPEGLEMSGFFKRAYATLAKNDPGAALEILRSDSLPDGAEGAAPALAKQLVKEQGAQALELLESIADPAIREGAIDEALKALAELDPNAAAAAYERVIAAGDEANIREDVLAKIVGSMAKDDPVAAYRWMNAIPAGSRRLGGKWNRATRALLTELPDNAKQMHALFSVDEDRESHLNTIGSWTVLKEADRIAAEALALPQDEVRDEILKAAVGRWAWSGDIEAAIRFAGGMPDENLRKELFTSIVESHGGYRLGGRIFEIVESAGLERIPERALITVIEVDPDAALAYVSELQIAHYQDASAVRRVASMAGRQDPERAIEWVDQIADPEVKTLATETFLGSWLGYDSIAASEWVTTLPEGSMRDTAAAQISESTRKSEPDSALQWGLSISDPTGRRKALEELAQQWAKDDRAAAFDGFLNHAADIDDGERAALLEIIDSTEQKQP